ncbi:MAG: DUF1592 domain-containing protein, partial [Acidobacteriota bacterium]|nr:DUF1592 domain-containing protein [Acidobacteriota bacterium]
MLRERPLHFLLALGVGLIPGVASAGSIPADVTPLFEASCLQCHGEKTQTPLNLTTLGSDLTDRATFSTWERIFERVDSGEMPPDTARRPDEAVLGPAMAALKTALVEANLAERAGQRTPLRRLTRLEYEYTIEDLLHVDGAVGRRLSQTLPEEADTGGFDIVAENQGISPLHIRKYLEAADRALDHALKTGPRPETQNRTINYSKSTYLDLIANGEFLGAGIVKMLDDAAVMFFDTGSTYTFHSMTEGFGVAYPGRYRATFDAYPYQAKSPVTMTIFQGDKPGAAASLNDLIGSFDLVNGEGRVVELTPYLWAGDLIAPSVADLRVPPDDYTGYFTPENNVKEYKGEGIAVRSLTIEGPLFDGWPPRSTQELLVGIAFDDEGQPVLTKEPLEHVAEVVANFAPRAFRRPLDDGELEAYASLAKPLLADGQPFVDAVRIPLGAILSAPPFIYHVAEPGELDDYGLATRLSYFLWRSTPDEELLELASAGRLSDPQVLAHQVDRLLDDPRSERFIDDFAGQAFRLYELLQTTPDKILYPEFDGRLGQAMGKETRLFLAELVEEDLGIGNLIDSDFTFLNRRLAEHYGIEGVEGQEMRKVVLAEDSPRGGLLTQASIHKITANGTTTSPVPRGNFVLDNLLGQPAPPPPAGVEGLEPDTRGATTIREQLDKHRSDPTCNSCHRRIDPPGFALESFDPIGGFRTTYRVLAAEQVAPNGFKYRTYELGPDVDITGVTPQGQ